MESSTSLCLRIITGTVWFGLAIASVVIGAIYKDNCPIQPRIPIFLMVTGGTHLAFVLFFFLRCFLEICSIVLEGMIGIFSFVWFIIGSVWVFGVYSQYKGPDQCDEILYYFAFAFLIFEYVIIGLGLIVPCCTCSLRTFWYERLD
ncbi:transmembrane protein 272-like [Leptodactylus fuscus]|uniref:transmembrane protein 272-like n=1 Tax=Leptodactylus fuscus TaxID=238119 RepID=UPI003F4EC754